MQLQPEQMAEMYKDGQTLDAIGRHYGVTRQRVHQVLKEQGLSKADKGSTYGGRRAAIEHMRTLYQSGKTMAQIAELMGVSRQNVQQAFKRYGVKRALTEVQKAPRKKVVGNVDITAVITQYQAGATLASIANTLGCDTSTVYYLLKRYGFTRTTGIDVTNIPPDVSTRIVQDFKDGASIDKLAQRYGETAERIKLLLEEEGVTHYQDEQTERERVAVELTMIACYKNGETLQEIGLKYGVTRQRVQQIFKKYNIDSVDRGCRVCGATQGEQALAFPHVIKEIATRFEEPGKTDKAVRAMTMVLYYKAGMTAFEIGDHFGITRQRVMQILSKHSALLEHKGCAICVQQILRVGDTLPASIVHKP